MLSRFLLPDEDDRQAALEVVAEARYPGVDVDEWSLGRVPAFDVGGQRRPPRQSEEGGEGSGGGVGFGDQAVVAGEQHVVASVQKFVDVAHDNSSMSSIQPGYYQMRTEIPAANAVVRFFQSPLERAMERYYISKALGDFKSLFGTVPGGATARQAVRWLNDAFGLRDCPQSQEIGGERRQGGGRAAPEYVIAQGCAQGSGALSGETGKVAVLGPLQGHGHGG